MNELAAAIGAALSFLPPVEARRLIDRCREREFAAGEILMAPDAPADYLGFVLTGQLAVKRASEFPGRFTLLAELEAGAMVGEGGLVTGEGHGVTVVATSAARLLILPRRQFLELCADDPALALKLLTRVIKVMRHRLHSAGARLSWLL